MKFKGIASKKEFIKEEKRYFDESNFVSLL